MLSFSTILVLILAWLVNFDSKTDDDDLSQVMPQSSIEKDNFEPVTDQKKQVLKISNLLKVYSGSQRAAVDRLNVVMYSG